MTIREQSAPMNEQFSPSQKMYNECRGDEKMVKIYAHRGFSGRYPENTMLAFEKAVELGCDGIELDIHYSKDREIMIQHDEAMRRTTGMDGFIFDYTRSELEKINAGKSKNYEFGFTPVPSFEEYLDYMKDRKMITNIELKTAPVYYEGIEYKVIDMIYKAGVEKKVIFSSFNWLSIVRAKEIAPEIPSGLLIEPKLFKMGSLIGKSGIRYFHPWFKTVDLEMVKDMHANGVGMNVWTVDEEADIMSMISLKVDGIITNYPDRAKDVLKEKE